MRFLIWMFNIPLSYQLSDNSLKLLKSLENFGMVPLAQSMTGHVFMSYSRKDEAVMRRVATFLRKQGISVWVDNEKLVPGTPIWEEEIEKAIRGSSAVIVILSPDSKNSVWVRREISFAEQYRKRIFPVMVAGDEDSSITLRLITNQYVDIRKDEISGIQTLGTAISFYMEGITLQEDGHNTSERESEEKVRHLEKTGLDIKLEQEVVTPDEGFSTTKFQFITVLIKSPWVKLAGGLLLLDGLFFWLITNGIIHINLFWSGIFGSISVFFFYLLLSKLSNWWASFFAFTALGLTLISLLPSSPLVPLK